MLRGEGTSPVDEVRRNLKAMVAVTQNTLDEVTRRLVEALKPERIYLFGSQAYGEPERHSDLDLLVVVENPDQRPIDLDVRAREAIGNVGCAVDVLVYEREQFDRRASWRANFEHTVREKGHLLYGG